MDFSASSKKALRWAADNLLRKGDTLVLLHIEHHGRDEAKHVLWSHSGSRKNKIKTAPSHSLLHCIAHVPCIQSLAFARFIRRSVAALIPLEELKDTAIRQRYDIPDDAEVLDMLDAVSREKELSVVLKLYWGDPREKVCEAVGELNLESLVMGSRGLGQIQRILLGSVTNYVLSNASCPVTVVKAK
ncbi:universal stress protein A-like protein [Hordeum vulgare]|nr:universal stress protein A-like protein [Hordeum vulgare]